MQLDPTPFPLRGPAPATLLARVLQLAIGLLIVGTAAMARAQGRPVARDTVPSDSVKARTVLADSSHRAQRLETQIITGTRLSGVNDRTAVRVNRLNIQSAAPGPASAAEILGQLPGVSMVDDQGSRMQPTLNLRGFTLSPVVGIPQGVSVFLDGVRINEPDAQELNFDLVPMEAVSHAELVRGPAALFGKNSLAGALLLTTKRGDAAPALNAEVETGAFGYHGVTVTGGGIGSVAGVHDVDAYIMARASDERGWRDDTGARTGMLFANIGRKRDSSDVSFTAMYAHDRALLAGSLPESWLRTDPQANFTSGDFFEPHLLHLALSGERTLPFGTMRGNLFFRRNNVEQFNVNLDAPSTRSLTDNRSTGGTAEWSALSHVNGHGLSLTIGTEYSRNDVGYHTFAETTPSSDTLPAGCDQKSGLCEHAEVPEDDAAFYAQGVLEVLSNLSLTAAARADYVRIPFRDLRNPANNGTNVFRQVSPRVGLAYRPNALTNVYASVSTGFRAPAALELACADENAPCSLPSALGDDPPLDPVTVITYEGGFDRRLGTGRIGVSAYRTDVRNDIVFVASTLTAGFFQNIARTRRQGVEITGDAEFPAGFRVNASYAYLDATYLSTVALASAVDGNVARPGDQFPLSPAHQGTLGLENTHAFRASVLSAGLSFKAVSSQFLRGDDANREQPL
ncbi:MAG TPA: TonB-dependent receptor, partial [Gemmatimonadaceae bacterium]